MAPKVEALRIEEGKAKSNINFVPVYPKHVFGTNDGSYFSDTEIYRKIIAMERKNTSLCAQLDKLVEDDDGFEV